MTRNKGMMVFAVAVSLFCVQAGFCADQPKRETRAKPGEKPNTASKASSDERLHALLRDWDRVRLGPREWHQKFTRTRGSDPDPFFDTKQIDRAEMWIKRPDHLRIETRDQKGDPHFTVLCVGERVRVYDFTVKQELSFSLPAGIRVPETVGQRAANNPGFLERINEIMVWSILGPPVPVINRCFTARLEKEDDYWSYIRLDPIQTQGWLPDLEGQVVLHKKNHWLRRVCLYNDRGLLKVNIETNFEEPKAGHFPPETWSPPFKELPKGWKTDDAALPPSSFIHKIPPAIIISN
jgi:hypothetical protein